MRNYSFLFSMAILLVGFSFVSAHAAEMETQRPNRQKHKLYVKFTNLRCDKSVAGEVVLYIYADKNQRLERYIGGKAVDQRCIISFSESWLRQQQGKNFKICVFPTMDKADCAISGVSEEMTYERLMTYIMPDDASGTENGTFHKELNLEVQIHDFIKMQTINLKDADGEPVTSPCWGIVPIPDNHELNMFIDRDGFKYMMRQDEKANPVSVMVFPLYSSLSYSFQVFERFGVYDTFGPVNSDEIAKFDVWRPKVDAGIMTVRLQHIGTPLLKRDYLDPKDNTFPDEHLCLAITYDPSENPFAATTATIGMIRGISRFQSDSYLQKGKKLYFTIIRESYDENQHKMVRSLAYKIENPIYQPPENKRVHLVDLWVAPTSADESVISATRLSVVERGSDRTIRDYRAHLAVAPFTTLGNNQPLTLMPGKHSIVVYANGYRLKEQEITIPPIGKKNITVEMEPLPEPVKITFDGPANVPTERLKLKLHYDAYPCLGVLDIKAIDRKAPNDSVPASIIPNITAKLQLQDGKGVFLATIDANQPFTLCANAIPSPKFILDKNTFCLPLPLMTYRHAKGAPAPGRIALKPPRQIVWKGKIDLAALNSDNAMVIWSRKLEGIDPTPVAAAAMTKNGVCSAPLEPGFTYERHVTLTRKSKDDFSIDYRSLPPYTVPADAKELPEETLTPGPAGSGVPVRDRIGGWMF